MKKLLIIALSCFCFSSYAAYLPHEGLSLGFQGGLAGAVVNQKMFFNSPTTGFQNFDGSAFSDAGLVGVNAFYILPFGQGNVFIAGLSFDYFTGQTSTVDHLDDVTPSPEAPIDFRLITNEMMQYNLLVGFKRFITKSFDVYVAAGFSLLQAKSTISSHNVLRSADILEISASEDTLFAGGKLVLGGELYLTSHSALTGSFEYAMYDRHSLNNFVGFTTDATDTLTQRSSAISIFALMLGYNYYF